MPNLVGKTYNDIVNEYNLKDEILEQLIEKDLEGTTYNLNTLKYLGDGSICIKGSYIIEGYGAEVESQKPAAGTKIKILNDGEGNVSLAEDIYLYIKGGGATEKINIDKDLQNEEQEPFKEISSNIIDNSNKNEHENYNDNANESETKEKIYIHTAQRGCTLINPSKTSTTVQYKYKCDYCGEIGKYQYSCDPTFHGGTYETNFKCNYCKESNIVEISTEEQYK